MEWKHVLAYITGSVDQELLVRNEYLVTENRILRQQITGRVQLSHGERNTLEAIGKKLGRQALAEVATIVKPETILAWHRMLVAKMGALGERGGPIAAHPLWRAIPPVCSHRIRDAFSPGTPPPG
jgi:putative transposase